MKLLDVTRPNVKAAAAGDEAAARQAGPRRRGVSDPFYSDEERRAAVNKPRRWIDRRRGWLE
jgi:hypothetical protein